MLEVLERPRLEVVDADDAVVARQQVLAEMRSEKPAPPVTRQVGIYLRTVTAVFMWLAEPAATPTGSSSLVGESRQIVAYCEKYRSFLRCEISQDFGHSRDRRRPWAPGLEPCGTFFPARCGYEANGPDVGRNSRSAASCGERDRAQ